MKSFLVIAMFSVSWLTTESSAQCNLPPKFWCSSRQIARSCQVEDQCEASVWSNSRPGASKVNFTLYYETLCPDSIEFISNQLSPTFFKVANIMNLELVPYGNARQKQVGDKWEFNCQHGPMECLGNVIQTCALHIYGNMSKVYPFVDCMENSRQMPNVSGPQCAKHVGFDYQMISKCADGPVGNKLEHDMAVKTGKLDPPHTYVPWVTLNGAHTEDIQNEAESNLLKLICDTYKGTKPDACTLECTFHKCLN